MTDTDALTLPENTDPAVAGALSFLAGGGEMGRRMRSIDWSLGPLGAPQDWPQSLKSTLSACLNSPLLGTVLWGPDLRMLYNDAYIVSMADRHPAALGRPVAQVWGDAWTHVAPPFLRALATGEGFAQERVEVPMVRNGRAEISYWNFTAAPIRGETGEIVGLLNQGIEITEQVRAETLRRAAEAELRQLNATLERRVDERTAERNRLWELSSDIMLRCGFDGVISAVNPAWTALLGWPEETLIGAKLFDFVHPDDRVRTLDGAKALSEGGSHTRFDNRYRRPDGSYRWISWSTRADADNIYAVGRDFTEERERAEALRAAEAALRQSQKMEAVGQLTGGLAHDFNNLLAGISGSFELMKARLAQGRVGDLERYVTAGLGATKRAAALTHRLLAFSRRQTLDPKPTDANRLIVGMEDLIRRSIGPQIALEAVASAGLWTTMVDPGQLENALLNLCINARDAMPEGGRVTIETANRWFDERTAVERGLAPGQYISVCVSDNGVGMSADVAAKAFDPFFTTKPIGVGTGLGLSMVYGFTRQSGGHARIHSEPGRGTLVCMYLPRHLGEAEAAGEEAGSGVAPRAEAGETVLVVDDEPTVRLLVVEVLQDLGYAALEAVDGTSAMRVLESTARVDLLVTDVGLPGGMNGRQVADAARVRRPGLKVLFITGYAENAVLNHGHLDQGTHVMTKPFAMDALAARIRELIKG